MHGKGLELSSLFPPRSAKSVEMFIKRYKPTMDALLIDQEYEASLLKTSYLLSIDTLDRVVMVWYLSVYNAVSVLAKYPNMRLLSIIT